MWINTEKFIDINIEKDKPCHILGWCPYGCIVEEFSLDEKIIKRKFKKDVIVNCNLFGHHCPMFYNAEDVNEQDKKIKYL